MQPSRLDHDANKPFAAHIVPTTSQAAAYIHDMTSSLRSLAVRHHLSTLALLLEMAAVEAANNKKA